MYMNTKIPGKILGIDLGTKKTGLAYSDESQTLAFAWKTIEEYIDTQLDTLIDLILNDPQGPFEHIVFGLPSQEGEWKAQIQAFALKLKSNLQEEESEALISFCDEDFSSFKAGQNLSDIKSKLPKKKRQQMDTSKDDAEAARIMLQSYLDNH